MKVKDIFDTSFDMCVDVYENIADLIGVAFTGGTKLSKVGEEKFSVALQFDIKTISSGMLVIDSDKYFKDNNINIDDYDFEENIPAPVQNLIDLFWSIAGYCSVEDYNKWFIE